jgi:hypothetical protein
MTWFLLKNEEICGPYETAHIVANCDDSSLIWGPGMEEWTDKRSWKSFLDSPKKSEAKAAPEVQITAQTTIKTKNSGADLENKSVEEAAEFALHQLNDKWFFAYEGKKFGPLNQSHLILKLSGLEHVEKALLWKKGQDNWRPLYEFPKLLNILNEKLDEKKAA